MQQLVQYLQKLFQKEVAYEQQYYREQELNVKDSLIDEDIIFEKKFNLVLIPYILLMKASLQSAHLDQVLQLLAPFVKDMFGYLAQSQKEDQMLNCCSQFFTTLLNFVNRLAVIKRDYFMNCVNSLGIPQLSFFEAWFSKMDYLVSNEAKRLNLISIYSLFPVLPLEFI